MKIVSRAVFFLLFLIPVSLMGQVVDQDVLLGGIQGEPPPLDVSGRYFVLFHSAPGDAERQMVESHGAQIIWSYTVIPGFAVYAPSSSVVEAIAQDPRVRYVDQDKVAFALGSEADPEVTDPANDQSVGGNATQDILKAWIQQPDDSRLRFFIKVRDLSGVDPTTGDGLGPNTIWKFTFSLQKAGRPAADQYFVEMRKSETGAPTFNWGYVDGTVSRTIGPADAGQILTSQGIIQITNSKSKFVGAPNGNGFPDAGDILASPFAQTQQLAGASGAGGLLLTIDRAPNTGGGRNYAMLVFAFSPSPRSLDFGSVLLGSSKARTIVVTNTSAHPLIISSVQSSDPAYAVSPSSAAIPPSANASFEVTFFPSNSGPHVATLFFQHNSSGSPGTVPVNGSAFSFTDGETRPWGIDAVKAPRVWDRTTGRTVKVAVLDTGIDSLHFELDDRFRGGYNFVLKTPHPWDGHGHGTHVSGTVTAELNGTGLMGVSHEVELYALKVLSDAGGGFFSDVYAAIDWCLQNGIHIANMSLGGRVYDPTGEMVFLNAENAGLLSIAAAGNGVNGVGTPHVSYPAAYQGVMAVGAVGRDLQRAAFSDFGPNIEIVAPGVDVRSTVPRGTGREAAVDHAGTTLEANPLQLAALTGPAGVAGQAVPSGRGLTPADFPAAVNGNIALIERGDITFAEKVRNAQDAGAIAVIIYNNAPGNFSGTLGTPRDEVRGRAWVPAASLSQADGQALVAAGSPTITLFNVISDFAKFQGTSMASPHTAGVAALVKGANLDLSNRQIRDILDETATDLGLPFYDLEYGHGLVNAEAAVNRAVVEPPVTRLECDDPRVSSSGGWHVVEDERATNGHYCRKVGNGGNGASLSFSYSGRHLDIVIARGPRGGKAEVFIDDVSRGIVNFYRAPSDPSKPDNSGKKDLTFGQVVSYETPPGEHTFRLVAANDGSNSLQSMLYVDEFVIHSGEASGTGNPVDNALSASGTLTGLSVQGIHTMTASTSTEAMSAVIEVTDAQSNVTLAVLDPLGAGVGQVVAEGATVSLDWTPSAASIYTVVVTNNLDRSESYRVYLVSTERLENSLGKGMPASVPKEIALYQNSPNPFNPTTNISYQLSEDVFVSLKVFDLLGREIATLISAEQGAGHHIVEFHAPRLASGVYFYRMEVIHKTGRSATQVRRMLLLK